MLATDFMKRRHLFDNGYPVCTPTLVMGAQVLLAVSRQSLRRSRRRLAGSLTGLADSADRVIGSRAHGRQRNQPPRVPAALQYAFRPCLHDRKSCAWRRERSHRVV